MTILPAFRAELDKDMSEIDCMATVAQIRQINGILSVGFNEKSRKMMVTYVGGQNVVKQVAKLPGVKIDPGKVY